VQIDPGIRNAGIVWQGFDGDNDDWLFAERKLQDKTPADYARAIREENARWGLKRVQYVVDPAARSRGQTNAETVLVALAKEGIFASPGQNDVEAGIGQGRTRMMHGRLHVSPECVLIRAEADDYAAQEPVEGKDDSHLVPIKTNDHRWTAARYGWMQRFWDPLLEQSAAPDLGFRPNQAPNLSRYRPTPEAAPMGR
jgi:hypothetical protein